MEEIERKWNDIYSDPEGELWPAVRVLQDNLHLLPAKGRALDLASGLGANALVMSARGLETHAWDISPVAIERLNEVAKARGLTVYGEARDVMSQPPDPDSFDVILVAHFLDRALVPHLLKALRPSGLLFYQTFTSTRVSDEGPSNKDFRLADNELLQLFSELKVVVYREEGRLGDIGKGFRDKALFIGQRI